MVGKEKHLGSRDLGRSARCWQEYEAIGNFRVATVGISESEVSFHLQIFNIVKF